MSCVHFFQRLEINDVERVGGKNASLGEMYLHLSAGGVKVPNGFAASSQAYLYYMQYNHLVDKVAAALNGLDTHNYYSPLAISH